MQLDKNIVRLYDNINYYNRYKILSDSYRNGDGLEKQDKSKVIDIISELGYSAKYMSKEKFYRIFESPEEYEFYFHIALKYGLCEIIFGATHKKTEKHIGGVIHGVCKLIEISREEITEGYIKSPIFKDYEELKEILKEAFSLYEDFKAEVVKL